MRKLVLTACMAGSMAAPALAKDVELGAPEGVEVSIDSDVAVEASITVVDAIEIDAGDLKTLELQIDECVLPCGIDGGAGILPGGCVVIEGRTCGNIGDGARPTDVDGELLESEGEVVTFSGVGIGITSLGGHGPPAHAHNQRGAEVMHMMSINGPSMTNGNSPNAPAFGLSGVHPVNQVALEQRGALRVFSGADNPRPANGAFRLFGRSESSVQTVSNRELSAGEQDVARQLANIDRLRDQALRTGDAKLLAQADAMETQVRAKSETKGSWFSRFTRREK